MRDIRRNAVLHRVLTELGWSPYDLARAVNRVVGSDRRVHATTPFTWRDKGVVPRDPLPSVVAGVLTEARGEVISVDELWQGRARQTAVWLPAADGVDDSWTPERTIDLLDQLRLPSQARTFFALSGPTLLDAAQRWQGHRGLAGSVDRPRAGQVTADLVDYLEADLHQLRRLDDGHGGVLVLKAVSHRLSLATDLLNESGYSAATGRRLLSVVGQLAQLGGWLNFDLGQHGEAQRLYLLGLRAASAAGDRALGGLVLSCMAFQQSWRNRPQDAVSLLAVARDGLRGAGGPRVAALLAMREARAFATTGDPRRCATALSQAHVALDADPTPSRPAWTYWLDQTVLTSEAGRCLLHLGQTPAARRHLSEGLATLHTEPSRDRILYGLSLALTYTRDVPHRRDLELACHEAQQVMPMLDQVSSARCRNLVQAMADDLRPHKAVPTVRTFLDQAEAIGKRDVR